MKEKDEESNKYQTFLREVDGVKEYQLTALGQDVYDNKNLRKRLDPLLQKLKGLPRSRERSIAITKLQESIMWLGMDLKRLNEPNPYPNSYKPENTIIEPTADNLKL